MTTTDVETREVEFADLEVRAGGEADWQNTFSGYAAVFDVPSEPLPFTERIAPGAFARSLNHASRRNIKLFVNHNTDLPLASTRANTLQLVEDTKGLRVEATLPDTTYARDLSVLMGRGDVNSMSFGFSVPRGGDSWNEAGTQRTLNEVRLHEVSVVTGFPAYRQTSAKVRSLDVLADRTGQDADLLAAAIGALEAGDTLSEDHAQLLADTVSKLRAASPEPEPPAVPAQLGRLVKQLDLLLQK